MRRFVAAWWRWRRRRPVLRMKGEWVLMDDRCTAYVIDDVGGQTTRFVNELCVWRLGRPQWRDRHRL